MKATKGKRKRPCVHITNAQTRYALSFRTIRKLALKILLELRLSVTLDLVFVSDRRIKKLNRLFHKRDRITDVLAFEAPAGWAADRLKTPFLGEVVISVDRTVANATRFHTSSDEELLRYVAHGVLHLLGEQDHTVSRRKKMFGRQEKIIDQLRPIPVVISKPKTHRSKSDKS